MEIDHLELHKLKLVTIVAETVLQDRITKQLLSWGATGFTVSDTTGKGSRGIRTGDMPGDNTRIECLVTHEVAVRILTEIAERYFDDYAVVAWVENVEVVRGEKYL